ncbi:MAG: hypothetical protein O2783_03065 [Chloroflexi bacterium]|nr:hypothetical protein [Chloroflexota bacterium]
MNYDPEWMGWRTVGLYLLLFFAALVVLGIGSDYSHTSWGRLILVGWGFGLGWIVFRKAKDN